MMGLYVPSVKNDRCEMYMSPTLTSKYTPDGCIAALATLTWRPNGAPRFHRVRDAILVWMYLEEVTEPGSAQGVCYEDMYAVSISECPPTLSSPIAALRLRDRLRKPITDALMLFTLPVRDLWWGVYVAGTGPYYVCKRLGLPYATADTQVNAVTSCIEEHLIVEGILC